MGCKCSHESDKLISLEIDHRWDTNGLPLILMESFENE